MSRQLLPYTPARGIARLDRTIRALRKMAPGHPAYTRQELAGWIDRRLAAADYTIPELAELFRDVHWCPRELGGVR